MSQYQNQYGAPTTGNTDEYGNPVNQLDQYGNPVSGGGYTGEAGRQHFGTTGGATGHGQLDQYGNPISGGGYTGEAGRQHFGTTGGATGHGQQHRGVDQTTGYETNTGGVGGYGTKPEYGSTNTGSGYGTNQEYGSTNTGSGYGTRTGYSGTGTTEYVREERHGDNKGVMDKIKEKIPGTEQSRHNTEGTHPGGVGGYGTKPEYGSTNIGSGYGPGTGYGGTGTTEYVREEHHGDKKGVLDKIKEKIPGTEQSRTNPHEGTGYGTTGYGASGGGIGNTGEQYVREEHHILPGNQKHGSTGQEYVKEERRGIGNTGQEYVREEHRENHGEKKGIMDKIKDKLPGTGACTGH